MRSSSTAIALLAVTGPLGAAIAVTGVALTGATVWAAVLFAVPIALITAAGVVWLTSVRANARRRRISARRQRRRARMARTSAAAGSLNTIIDGIDAPVVATDSRGIVELCNTAALTLLDRPRGRLIGEPIEILFTQGELLAMHQQAGRGKPQTGRIRLQRDGAIRTYEVGAHPHRSENGRHGVVLTFRDVSELATAMQLKTDFVANASHELRTPLAAIRGAVDTLAELDDDEADLRRRLTRMIADNSARLEELMSDLLDLSRLESPDAVVQVRPMDPRELPARLGPMFDTVCVERDLEIAFDIPPSLDRIDSDRQLLELAIKNLIDNACKYAYEGSTVRVTVSVLDPSSHAAPSTLRIEVADRGLGVPIQDQPRIFERFYQVDQSRAGATPRRGTGLGLAIVKHAVRSLDGTIGLESVWKQGSTFWIELPKAVPASTTAATSGSEQRPHPGAGPDAD